MKRHFRQNLKIFIVLALWIKSPWNFYNNRGFLVGKEWGRKLDKI